MSNTERARKDVLVADGVDFYRRMLVELMRGQGYNVGETEDTDSTLAYLERERPDLVVLDLGLPPGGGRALLDRVRGNGNIRFVGLSHASVDDTEVERMRDLGVTASVCRSAPIDDILAATRTALFPDAKNLRRSPRAQVHIPVSYRVESEGGENNGDFTTHTFNLSADGMFLVTTAVQPAAPGTKLEVRFWLPAASEVIRSEGVVVWCNQAGGRVNELYPPGMGVMFLGLARDAAAVINEYVRERSFNPFR